MFFAVSQLASFKTGRFSRSVKWSHHCRYYLILEVGIILNEKCFFCPVSWVFESGQSITAGRSLRICLFSTPQSPAEKLPHLQTISLTKAWLTNYFSITFHIMSYVKMPQISSCNRNEWFLECCSLFNNLLGKRPGRGCFGMPMPGFP